MSSQDEKITAAMRLERDGVDYGAMTTGDYGPEWHEQRRPK